VVFLSHEEGGAPRLIRFAWHKPAPEPFISRIPGAKEVYEIVLGARSDLELKTSYISTKRDNPLMEQIPRVVKKIEPAFLALLERKTIGASALPVVNFEVRRVTLPFTRAKIKISDIAVLSEAAFEKTVKIAASKLAEFLEFRHPEYKTLTGDILGAIRQVQSDGSGVKLAEKYGAAVESALKAHLKAHPLRGESLEGAIGIEQEYLEAIASAKAKEVKADFDYENAPWERFSFGVASAILLGKAYADERVRLTDDGYYAVDPPENPLAAVLLNIHPISFDPESAKMTPAERFRLFMGVVLNPDAGACAGAGFALLRGLSLNAGLAFMAISAVKDPKSLVVSGRDKRAPGNPRDPFSTKWRTVGFVGFGYNF
jgi:hypothetical protein